MPVRARVVLVLDMMWRLLCCEFCLSKTVDEIDFSAHDNSTGSEWLCVEEPVGFFFPVTRKRMQFLELDQAQHVLHYGNFKHVIRLHGISLITSTEETDQHGETKWLMNIQDPSTLQSWVIHFPSRHRLEAWIDLLQAVFRATNTSAVVSNIITLAEPPSSPTPPFVPFDVAAS